MSIEQPEPVASEGGNPKRVGNAERQVAVEQLDEHWHAGRLDPGEHELRVTRARVAVTQADVDGLFNDLPKPGRMPEPSAANRTGAMAKTGSRAVKGGMRETIMSLMPFAALVAFFTLGHNWLWFLMVPVSGILLYGSNGRPDGRHGWFWGRSGK